VSEAILVVGVGGNMAPDPILWRFNTPGGSRKKRVKTPEFVGSRRSSKPSIVWGHVAGDMLLRRISPLDKSGIRTPKDLHPRFQPESSISEDRCQNIYYSGGRLIARVENS
jgi:hypothetical protein